MIKFSTSGVRLDQALAFEAGTSRAKVQEWIQEGLVRLDGVPMTKASYKLKGETVEVEPPPPRAATVIAEDLPLEVLYEDADMIVLNKAPGMITHPAPGVYTGTIVNAILGRYGLDISGEDATELVNEKPELIRPGIVHRLDKDTSGVIVVARHEVALRRLSEAFAGREVFKRYLAVSVGIPQEGILSAAIGRHPVDRTRMHINGDGARFAQSEFDVIDKTDTHALVSVVLHTGRTHQIRVHLKHLHTPILGDETYGRSSDLIPRQALHAYELRIKHPRTGRYIEFVAPVPRDMVQAWESFGKVWPEEIVLREAEE